jgi:hypothetical protein
LSRCVCALPFAAQILYRIFREWYWDRSDNKCTLHAESILRETRRVFCSVAHVRMNTLHKSDKTPGRYDPDPQQQRNESRKFRANRQHAALVPRFHVAIDEPLKNGGLHACQ